MELIAVYTGDSTNFNIFQIVDEDGNVVGSLYFNKKNDLPEGVDVNLITPKRDHHLWTSGINFLLGKSRDGSKNQKKLKQVMKSYRQPQ